MEAAFAAAPGPDDEDDDDDAPVSENDQESLLVRIGGKDTVKVIIHLFHNRILADVSVKTLMEGVNTRGSKEKMGDFFTAYLGEILTKAQVLQQLLSPSFPMI